MTTKYCSKGQHEVDVALFRKSSRNKDGLQAWCSPCMNSYEKERYQNGDRARKERNDLARLNKNREYVKSFLQTNSCIDCGDSDWWNLDFDHINPATKTKEICYFIRDNGLKLLIDEIAKCVVRCTKCHRRRTIEQFGWWRTIDTGIA